MNRLRTTLVLGLAALAITGASAAPSLLDALPADTVFVTSTPSLTQLREDFAHSPGHALWNDPAVQTVFEPLQQQIDGFFAGEGGQQILQPGEFSDLFPGQIAVGLMRASVVNGVPDIAPFFMAETNRPQRVLEIVDQLIERAGAQQSRDTYTVRDVTVQRNTLTITESTTLPGETSTDSGMEMAMAAQTVTLHTAVTDGLVILSIDEPLETVINNLREGGDGGLQSGTAYQSAAGLLDQPEGDFAVFVRPAAFDTLLRELVPDDAPINPGGLGLSDIPAMGAWVDYTREATNARSSVALAPNARGIGRLFSHLGPFDPAGFDMVPADVLSASTVGYDMAAAVETIKQIVFATFPQAREEYPNMIASLTSAMGFNPETDFLQLLGDQMTTYTVESETPDTSPFASPITSVYLLDVTDADRVSQTLAGLAEPADVGSTTVQGGAALESHDYQGQTYYTPPAIFAGEDANDLLPSFAVIGDKFVFASTGTEMRSVISAAQGGLATNFRASEHWSELEAMLARDPVSIAFQDDAKMMKMVAQSLQQMAFFFMMMETPLPLNLAAMPPEEIYDQYLTHTLSGIALHDGGVVMWATTPHNP